MKSQVGRGAILSPCGCAIRFIVCLSAKTRLPGRALQSHRDFLKRSRRVSFLTREEFYVLEKQSASRKTLPRGSDDRCHASHGNRARVHRRCRRRRDGEGATSVCIARARHSVRHRQADPLRRGEDHPGAHLHDDARSLRHRAGPQGARGIRAVTHSQINTRCMETAP